VAGGSNNERRRVKIEKRIENRAQTRAAARAARTHRARRMLRIARRDARASHACLAIALRAFTARLFCLAATSRALRNGTRAPPHRCSRICAWHRRRHAMFGAASSPVTSSYQQRMKIIVALAWRNGVWWHVMAAKASKMAGMAWRRQAA
jgi:hypothetical protein